MTTNTPTIIDRRDLLSILRALYLAHSRQARLAQQDSHAAGYQAGFEAALEAVAVFVGVELGAETKTLEVLR